METTTDQQQDDNSWPFAGCYAEKYGFLPPSQRREAVKRLTTRRRNPFTVEQCAEESPEVEAVLAQVFAAYQRKKLRSKAASAAKRAPPREEEEPQPQPLEPLEPDTVEPGFAKLSIEPEPPQPEPPQPEPPAPEPPAPPQPEPPAPLPVRDGVSQRAASVRPQPQPRRSMFQSPAPAPVQPKKVAGGLRAALMRRGV
jgi:hypothetical protein